MCGVFGIRSDERDVARLAYFGLFALQHRGQESAGIAVSDDGRLTALRDLGLVTQVFDEQKLHGLRDLVGAGYVREVERGEAVLIDESGLRSVQALPAADPGALCIFEFFYLARPDTQLAGIEVHGARVRMGERLAKEAPADVDLVLPIPDSGTPAAIGFSRATRIAFSGG